MYGSRADEKATGNRVSGRIKSRALSIIDRRGAAINRTIYVNVNDVMYLSTYRAILSQDEIRMRDAI